MTSSRQYIQQMACGCQLLLCLITINSVLFTESLAQGWGSLAETPAPSNPSQGLQAILTCEGEVMEIDCSQSATIKISTADLGPGPYQPRNECNTHDHQGEDCSEITAFQTVDNRCSKRNSCNVAVTRPMFGLQGSRSCSKAVKIFLHVKYTCISIYPPTEPSKRYTPLPTSTMKVEPTSCGPSVGSIRCLRCLRRNITWPETQAGEWATAPCPNNEKLMEARLQCGSDPVAWIGHPDLSKCISSRVGYIQSQLKMPKDHRALKTLAVDLTAISHESAALAGGDMVGITEAMSTVVEQLDVSAQNTSAGGDIKQSIQQVSSAVMDVTNTFLDDQRSSSWHDIPHSKWGSVASQLMNTVEASAFQMASALSLSQKVTNVNENLVVEVSVIDASADVSMEDAVFPSADALKGSSWEKTTNSLRLPAESLRTLAENGLAKVVFTSYSNLENLLLPNALSPMARSGEASRFGSFCSVLAESDNCSAIINTKIISATINSRKLRGNEMLLPKPVVFTLQHRKIENVSDPVCAYWKLNDQKGSGGQWMTDGCQSVSNQTHTTCSCVHLTSFAVIMSPTSPNISAANALALDVLTYIGCSISIICLFLCFLTFACFRGLQCDRNTIHKNLVLCLFIANMIFIIGIDLSDLKIFCSVIAGFLHYFFLVSFAWMCIEGVQLYYMLIKVFEADKSHVLWFYLSAYGVPAIIVAISAAVYHEGYGTEKYCWLTTDDGFIWAFLAPVICIILANGVMLGIALKAMYQHSVNAATWRMKEKTKVQQIRSWVKGSLVLVVLLGLTWTFGLLFVNQATIAFAYIFTILNSIQGLFIFIFHCLLNDKVQAEYKRCVRNATWLPERFRIWYGGARASYTSNPNQSNSSSTGGKYFSKLLPRQQRTGSQSTSISRLTSSQRRSSLLKQDEEKAMPAVVSDSGIEDPSSYQENVQIHVGDSEFNSMGDSSILEGSIADTDYAERMTQRQSVSDLKSNNTRSTPISSITSDEESRKESRPKQSRKSRSHPTAIDPVSSDQHEHQVQSPPQCTDNVNVPNPDSVPSQRPPNSKRKSSKTRHQDSGGAEILNSEKIPGYTDSHQRAADDSKTPNNGVQTDDDVARRHSKPRTSSSARLSGKTTGV